ncbi:MAG TPA: alpha-L-fucosidase [Gemmatimonadaceae bacterium]|nr:alpha-L-fucosidase [Gemmatimonadaceae bacterium]
MQFRTLALGTMLAALAYGSRATPLVAQSATRETAAQKDARMAWWRDAQFGMFIHWGAYSVPAGVYHGERIGGIGEWIMNSSKVPIPEYEQFVRAFNPTKYDAEQWVRTAKDAGMKYIILTSKHHDGFALFDSKVSTYDAVDAAGYHKDALKALAEAAHRQGMKFGVYYSIMDWHHPDAQAPNAPNYNSRESKNPNFNRYVETYMKPQLRELLTQYPAIDVLWFDGEWVADWSDDQGRQLYDWLRAIKPSLIINNRVGHSRAGMQGMSANADAPGDFGTPEQQVPATGLPGVDWETCMTMNDTWGFKSFDDGWKDTRTLVRTMIDAASKGGNFLLNVGPTSAGEIPPESVARLREMGKWMRVNGESIYATSASPVAAPTWGRYTSKAGRVYAHVFDWPKDHRLALTGLTTKPRAAYLLADKKPLVVEQAGDGFVVTLPNVAPSSIASVVVLEQ